MKTRERIFWIIESILIAFALPMRQIATLNRADYKSVLHYLYGQIVNILGEYSFSRVAILVLVMVFLYAIKKFIPKSDYKKGWILPLFLSACLLIGNSYAHVGSLSECFGDRARIFYFFVCLSGWTMLLRELVDLFFVLYTRAQISKWKPTGKLQFINKFLGEKSFRNVFILLLVLWMPAIILSYPGNLCYDFIGQISQGLGIIEYSSHHPLFSTLFISAIIKIGQAITGSLDIGLFLYICIQAISLSAAIAALLKRLYKRNVSIIIRLAVLFVYIFSPVYSNMVSTGLKDIPFMAAVIWYLLLFEEFIYNDFSCKAYSKKGKIAFYLQFVLAMVLVGLLRNNGIYMVALTGLISGVILLKKQWKKALKQIILMTIVPLILVTGINSILSTSLNAQKGSYAEMFSVPFQQTARYLQLYRDEITSEEKEAIEAVLSDVNEIIAVYDPDIADPVKALFVKDSGMNEMTNYLKVWAKMFTKHPGVYFEAFFVHVYGWFDPGVTNVVRYEAESDLFQTSGISTGNKLLIFIYRITEHIPILTMLENVGLYTWMLFILTKYVLQKKRVNGDANQNENPKKAFEKRQIGFLLIPLFIALLICMASPCFYLHPRYAYPIVFTLPFMYGIMSKEIHNE